MEQNINNWIYFLRGHIDTAIRWNIKVTMEYYSSVFDPIFKESHVYLELFKADFLKKICPMNEIQKHNYYSDLKIDFESSEVFIKWYEDHKKELEVYEPRNPYKLLKVFCFTTLREIETLNNQ